MLQSSRCLGCDWSIFVDCSFPWISRAVISRELPGRSTFWPASLDHHSGALSDVKSQERVICNTIIFVSSSRASQASARYCLHLNQWDPSIPVLCAKKGLRRKKPLSEGVRCRVWKKNSWSFSSQWLQMAKCLSLQNWRK